MNSLSRVLVLALCLLPSLGGAEDSWDLIGPNGGWVNDLDRDASGRILAATSFGGIYRSSDNAESWQQIYDGTLIFDPRCVATNASGHVFVGSEGIDGVGFLRSTDDGVTWQVVSNNLSSRMVTDLLVAPNQNIFACTFDDGLFRSSNGGTTFTLLSGLPASFTTHVEANSSGDLFVGVQFESANLLRSTDNGASWQQADTGIGSDVVDIHASGSMLYATAINGVYRSTNNGTNWTNLNAPPGAYNSVTVAANGDICASFYGGITLGGRVYRSTNGGASWTEDSGLPGHAVDGLLSTPEGLFVGAKGPGVFRHSGGAAAAGAAWEQKVTGMVNTWIVAIADDPVSQYLYAATRHTRVLRSSNGGASWESASNGIEVYEQLYSLAVNTDGTVFASGAYDGIYRSTDQGANWTLAHFASATALACNPEGQIFAGYGSQMYRSTNNGTTWTSASLPGVQYILDIAFDGTTVYAACGTPGGFGSKGVYRSTDNGSTFASFSNGLTDLNVKCVAVGDPFDGLGGEDCRITAGTGGSGISHLNEASGIWEQDEDYGEVHVVQIDKYLDSFEPPRGLIAEKNRLRLFLPNLGCQAEELPSPLLEFTWAAWNANSRYEGSSDFWVGTVGHGIYQRTSDAPTDVSPAEPLRASLLIQNDPNPFDRKTVIEFEVASREIVTLKVFDASGREVAKLVEAWKDPGRHTVAWDAAGWPSGVYFSRLWTAGSEQSRRLVLVR